MNNLHRETRESVCLSLFISIVLPVFSSITTGKQRSIEGNTYTPQRKVVSLGISHTF